LAHQHHRSYWNPIHLPQRTDPHRLIRELAERQLELGQATHANSHSSKLLEPQARWILDTAHLLCMKMMYRLYRERFNFRSRYLLVFFFVVSAIPQSLVENQCVPIGNH
jgi:hypothetical protein